MEFNFLNKKQQNLEKKSEIKKKFRLFSKKKVFKFFFYQK